MTASTTAGRPRLRELRCEAGWTQQQLAEKLAYLAWTRHHQRVAANADMVAKWERGAKGISPRYRTLLCQLFGITAEQLGIAPAVSAAPGRPVRDPESLVLMLDDAASLLDQLGAAGTALAPQMLPAWKDILTSRRTMLGLLDPAATDPAGHARRHRHHHRLRTARPAVVKGDAVLGDTQLAGPWRWAVRAWASVEQRA
jgi:transcriptional regulator with XRE-family HTH domain